MPAAPDERIAAELAEFRVETERRFGAKERDLVGFRSAVETELGIIRNLGKWLLTGVFGLVAAIITGAGTIEWSASAIVSEARHQDTRINQLEVRMDRVEKQLEGMDRKRDTLLSRSGATEAEFDRWSDLEVRGQIAESQR